VAAHPDYDEALTALQRALQFGMNPSLAGITALADQMGRPQDSFAAVQITGTNGKTSTTHLTAALLRAEGLRVGLYTSPHLVRYNERIEIGGEAVSDAEFAAAIGTVLEAAHAVRPDEPLGTPAGFTEFELLTAAGLWLFHERDVEIAVLEVGLGGRWDATSVVSPSVSVITGVGLDHTAVLGDTLDAIATEKAAIIRPRGIAVLGPGTDGLDAIFLRRAEEVGARVWAVREDLGFSPVAEEATTRFRVVERSGSAGGFTTVEVDGAHGRYEALTIRGPAYQAGNVATAVTATEAAIGRPLCSDSARAALSRLAIPGRFEVFKTPRPDGGEATVVLDGAHNPQAAAVLAGAVREAFGCEKPSFVLGVLADKNAEGIVEALAQVIGRIVCTTPDSPRALAAQRLAEICRGHELVTCVVDDPVVALGAALAESELVVVTGSLYLVGAIRAQLTAKP
jgi:dihydrofolate synthase/folylpolyglutamate synthase